MRGAAMRIIQHLREWHLGACLPPPPLTWLATKLRSTMSRSLRTATMSGQTRMRLTRASATACGGGDKWPRCWGRGEASRGTRGGGAVRG